MDTIKTTRTQHHHQQHSSQSLSHSDDVPVAATAVIQSSGLNSNHKARAARIDAQSQRKVLSRSVIAESLDYFLPKTNPRLVRTVSDSRKVSQSDLGLVVSKAKANLNPEKERWRRKFYGGEIVKLIYDTSKEKKNRRMTEPVNGLQPRQQQQQQQKQAHEEEERGGGGEDVDDVKKKLANLEIVEVKKIEGVRKDGEGDLKRINRRRSFCGEETSLSSFLSSNGARIVAVDMPPFMQIHAIDCARKAYDSLEKFTSKSLALSLKKEFDGVYGPAWHCIVGTSFGSFVTHSVGGFLYFSLDHKMYILLFKTTVQRAD